MKNSELSLWRAEMTSKYDIRTLGELSVGNKGSYGIAASAVEYSEDLFTYLRISDITDDGRINKNDLKSVKEQNAKDYLLKPNDIVFARTGGSTGRNYFYDGKDGQFVYAGFLIKFSINPQKVNPKYIKYYCQSKIYRDWVHSFNTGSTRGNINAQTYSQLPIILPPRTQQDILVKMLSSLDDKIELNNKINQNLEQQAQAIFKSWFVDFEPFGGNMPENWERSNLLEIANYLNGLAMQKYRPKENELYIPILKIKELRQGFCDNTSDICTENINDAYIVNNGDIIFSWSGSLLVDIWCGGKCGLNQHLFKVTSEKYDKWFYYFWTKHHLSKFVVLASDMATTMGHIKREELQKSEVIIPNKEDYQKINNIIDPILNLIINNKIQNKQLTQLRDTLLPKLMSGEIDVDKVEV